MSWVWDDDFGDNLSLEESGKQGLISINGDQAVLLHAEQLRGLRAAIGVLLKKIEGL